SKRRHTIFSRDWSSDVCSSDLDHRRNAEIDQLGQFLLQPVHRKVEHPRHGGNLLAHVFPLHDKQRSDQVGDVKARLPDHAANGSALAQPTMAPKGVHRDPSSEKVLWGNRITASTKPSIVYSDATASTRRPNSSAVRAVMGPMHAL